MKQMDAQARELTFRLVFLASILMLLVALWDDAYNNSAWRLTILIAMATVFVLSVAVLVYNVIEFRRVPLVKKSPAKPIPEDLRLPRTQEIITPVADSNADLEWAPFEVGVAGVNWRNPARVGWSADGEAQEAASVLCSECGDYFRLDLGPERPVTLHCPGCDVRLALDGSQRFEPILALNCKKCDTANPVAAVDQVKTYHCKWCGQINAARFDQEHIRRARGMHNPAPDAL